MSTTKQFLKIGKIIGTHGLNGRLKIFIISDIIERFKEGNTLYIKIDEEYKEYKNIEFIENPGRSSLIKLEGISDVDTALTLKGFEIYINKNEAEKTRGNFESDTYYYYDIIGCKVFNKGSYFGEVIDIIKAGEGDVLVLNSNDGKELLVPFIQSMVDTKDVFAGKVYINPIDGLF